MNELLQKVQDMGVVPVVVLNDVKDAAPLAKALCEGGLPCAEVTFRTEAAEESIRIMATEFPEMLIGAGTVLTTLVSVLLWGEVLSTLKIIGILLIISGVVVLNTTKNNETATAPSN